MWDLDSLLQRMAESVVLTLLPSITLAWDSTGDVSPGLVTQMSQTHVLTVRHVSNTCPIVIHVSDKCLDRTVMILTCLSHLSD